MMLALNDVGARLGGPPIPQEAMDLMLWQNTARLWKIDTARLLLAQGRQQ